jgi:hypothetical protein
MEEQFGNPSRKHPSMTWLSNKIRDMCPTNNKFLRYFITFGMCPILAPTTGVRISPMEFPSLVNIKSAKDVNMCSFFHQNGVQNFVNRRREGTSVSFHAIPGGIRLD